MSESFCYGSTSVRTVCGIRTDFTGREHLVNTLTSICSVKQANAIVDALDNYSEERGSNGPILLGDLTPNLLLENERLRAELDRAIELAEQTVQQMQTVLDSLRASSEPVKAAAE